MPDAIHGRRRWLALTVLCLGMVMIVIDGSVVYVALPSIRADLGFSETSLVWLVNAYILTFGGFQLLGGRLGDLYGARNVFLTGIVGFTLASLACGLATSQTMLIWARAVQGLGGAVVDAVAFALIINMFTEPGERAKVMGVCGLIFCAVGSVGVFLGGIITTSLSWHWVFLINLPVGALVYVLCLWLIPAPDAASGTPPRAQRLDVFGAVMVTGSLVLAVYAVINGNEAGWTSRQSVGMLSVAVVLMALFLVIESRVRAPLVPLGLFRSRALLIANIAAVLWAAATFAWGFMGTLYLQRVLGHNAVQVALAFLPANVVTAVVALGFSARIVSRFGIRIPFAVGLLLGALGLALFAGAPVNGNILTDVLPGMTLLGIGSGIFFNPLLLAAMSGVEPKDSGLASGLLGTSSMMGGALGLAVLASAAAAWTQRLRISGAEPLVALNGGYHLAFAIGAVLAATAAVLGVVLLPAGGVDKLSPHQSGGITP
jgi:EmrB/QacA subfamily drug resistance transporter